MSDESRRNGRVRSLDPGRNLDFELKAMLESERIHYRPGQFVPRDELVAAFKGLPCLDYEELRADIDAHVDPSPWGWDDWKAWADRYFDCDSADHG